MDNITTYYKPKSILQAIQWPNVVVYSVMISAFIPKLIVSDGVNIFLPEFIMALSLILGVKQFIAFPEQRLLLGVFLLMLLFSIVAQASVSDVGAILRSFKEILYVPIIFWASTIENKEKVLRNLMYLGCVAFIVNLTLFIQNFSLGASIWADTNSMSSGTSNKAIDLLTFKLVQLPGLSHGIWGSYCVLIYVLAVSLRKKQIISRSTLFVVSFLFFINIVISISRETLVILGIVFVVNFFKSKQSAIKRISVVAILTIFILGIAIYGSDLPVAQKVIYTYNSFSSNGSENNISVRMNTWQAYFKFVAHNVEYLFVGTGISPDNFYNHIYRYARGEIVPVPESAIVYAQAYGGIFAAICLLLLLLLAALKINRNCSFKLIKYFFLGVLLTNIFSSVSMFSDLFYAHLCLVYGLLIVKNDEF